MNRINNKVKLMLCVVFWGVTACGGNRNNNNSAFASPDSNKIVFVRQVSPDDNPSSWGNTQIFRMNNDGSNLVNLSNRNRSEKMPSVSYDSKQIVFVANANNLYFMAIDGSEMQLIPNAQNDVGYPKWSRGNRGKFILYNYPYSRANSAIYRINPDGSNLTQITHPAPNENDVQAVSIDDQYIIFRRFDQSSFPWKSDLYVKNIWDNSSEVLLTNTPPNCQLFLPVVSHNGKKLAYRVMNLMTGKDWIHIADFLSANTIIHENDLYLASPASMNISGIDFSADDKELIISLQANDVSASQISRKQEIFKVSLDGSNQIRLTLNSDMDEYPSVIP